MQRILKKRFPYKKQIKRYNQVILRLNSVTINDVDPFESIKIHEKNIIDWVNKIWGQAKIEVIPEEGFHKKITVNSWKNWKTLNLKDLEKDSDEDADNLYDVNSPLTDRPLLNKVEADQVILDNIEDEIKKFAATDKKFNIIDAIFVPRFGRPGISYSAQMNDTFKPFAKACFIVTTNEFYTDQYVIASRYNTFEHKNVDFLKNYYIANDCAHEMGHIFGLWHVAPANKREIKTKIKNMEGKDPLTRIYLMHPNPVNDLNYAMVGDEWKKKI